MSCNCASFINQRIGEAGIVTVFDALAAPATQTANTARNAAYSQMLWQVVMEKAVPALSADASGLTNDPELSVATLTQGDEEAEVSEVQTVVRSANVSGGTFTLDFDGDTTDPIAWNASAAAVQAALEALAGISAGGVSVSGSGSDASPWTITFDGEDLSGNQPQLTADAAGLTTPAPAISFGPAEDGPDPAGNGQTVYGAGQSFVVEHATGGDFTLSFDGETTDPIDFDASAAEIQTALEALDGIGAGEAIVTVLGPGFLVSCGGSMQRLSDAQLVVEVSLDGLVWTPVGEPFASSGSLVLEAVAWPHVRARLSALGAGRVSAHYALVTE